MLIVPVDELAAGDRLGRALYSVDGRLMLERGAVMNAGLIERIKKLGYRYASVEPKEERVFDADAAFKRNLLRMNADMLRLVRESVRERKPFPERALTEWADQTAASALNAACLSVCGQDLASDAKDFIDRSSRVCLLSVLTAKTLGYSKSQLEYVAIGSLLHDIGLLLPHDGTLLLDHPIAGYEYLRKYRRIPEAALRIVLQHHERIDGRGFPNGLSGNSLLESSQICGLASDFDEFMNQSLSVRKPSEGIDFLMSKIDTSYAYPVVRAFMTVFRPYPVGMKVKLSGGLTGTVCAVDPANVSRPVVQLDRSDMRIDLMKHLTFEIEKALPL